METIAPQRAVQLTLVAELTNELYGNNIYDVDIAYNNNTHNNDCVGDYPSGDSRGAGLHQQHSQFGDYNHG